MKHLKIFEESGDYSTEAHAIADVISKKLEALTKGETSGDLKVTSDLKDLLQGLVKFELIGPDKTYQGQIVVEVFDKSPK